MMIGVLGSLAEYEHEHRQGADRLRSGRHPAPTGPGSGGPARSTTTEHIATAKRMKADGHTGKDIAKYLGVSRATLYRYLADEAA